MKKRISIIFILIILVVLIYGFTHKVSTKNDLINDTIVTLASNDFKGRLAGTEGNEKAVEYLTNTLEDIGLDTYKENSYLHHYSQKIYHPDKQEHLFSIILEDDTIINHDYGNDYLDYYTINYDLYTTITFDPKDKGLNNKIIVLDDNSKLNSYKGKAKGIFIREDHFFKNINAIGSNTPVIQISDKVYEILKTKNIKTIDIKSKYNGDLIEASNVVGIIPGKNNNKALVLSAHFDHVGWSGNKVFEGAIDNASGVSVLLDLVERLKIYSRNNPFDMDIVISFLNGEESGLIGSKALVKELKDNYDELYNINIDCVGMKGGGNLKIEKDINMNYELIEELCNEFTKEDIKIVGGQTTNVSDHLSFVENNIASLNIGQNNIFKEGQSIHTIKDKKELVDYDYLDKVSDALYNFIISSDGTIYKLDKHEVNEDKEADIYSDMKLLSELIQLQKEEGLEYNERKIIEYQDFLFEIIGEPNFDSLESIKKYYPGMVLPTVLEDYQLKSISITEKEYLMGIKKIEDKDTLDINTEQAHKRDVSKEDIESISIRYESINKSFDIEVVKEEHTIDYIYRDYDLIPTTIGGDDVILLKLKNTELYFGAYRIMEVSNKKYHVIMHLYGENKKQVNGIYYPDNKVEDIRSLINNIDFKEIIEGLGL